MFALCVAWAIVTGSSVAAGPAESSLLDAMLRAREAMVRELSNDPAALEAFDRFVKAVEAEPGAQTPTLSPDEADRLIRVASEMLRRLQENQRNAGADDQDKFDDVLKAIETVLQELHTMEIAPRAEAKVKKTAVTRMTIGLEQSASAAKDISSRFVADFGISAPFGQNHLVKTHEQGCTKVQKIDIGPRSQVWGRIRLTSQPQEVNAALGAVDIPASVLQLKTNQTVQGLEYIFGYEYRLWNGGCLPSGVPKAFGWFSLSAIAGGGATTPLVRTSEIAVFKFDAATRAQELPAEFDEAKQAAAAENSKIEFVALVPPDRRTLYFQYWAGLRFKTDLLDAVKGHRVAFPGVIDFTVGKNEAITGGTLKDRWVAKVDGFYPIPIAASKSFYLFGSTTLQIDHRRTGDEPSPLLHPVTDKSPPADDIFILNSAADARDIWKIGVGVDLIQLFKPKS
jgi:hypothetical protein